MRHNLSYKPWYPHPKRVRFAGVISSDDIVIIWFRYVWVVPVPFKNKGAL